MSTQYDHTNDEIEIISVDEIPSLSLHQQSSTSRLRPAASISRRRRRNMANPSSVVDVINVEELVSEEEQEDDDDIEITDVRPLEPLPPPQQQVRASTNLRHVLHAPGRRTFPMGLLHETPVRSFPNTRSRTINTTRIRSPLEMLMSYQQRMMESRRLNQNIQTRIRRGDYNNNNNNNININNNNSRINHRVWSMVPHELGFGMSQFFFPGTINDLMFRNESSEADDDYRPSRDQEERETEFWINRIQQMEARENDERVNKRLKFSQSYHKQLLQKVNTKQQQEANYFNSVQSDKLPCCIQCGVELGEGIPSNHVQSDKPLVDLIKETKSPAPYEYFTNFTEADLLNSKKIFFSKNCGHLYCGRCIQYFKKLGNNNANNKKLKKTKVLIDELNGVLLEMFENGEPIVNLKRCCGFQCNANLHRFYEVYF